jgi:hypothetical protein
LGQAFFVWHLPVDETNTPHPAALPAIVARAGLMPALAWLENRYLLAFIRPSLTEPVLVVRALDRLGQLTEQPELVAATTEAFDKVGWPVLAANGPRGALFWLTEAGAIQARTLSLETGSLQLGERLSLAHRPRTGGVPLQARALPPAFGGGYLLCWGEQDAAHFELKLAHLSERLELLALRSLLALPRAPLAYDWGVNEQGVTLLYLDAASQDDSPAPPLWQGSFTLDGWPLQPPQPLAVEAPPQAIAAFADGEGRRLLWLQQPPQGPTRIMSQPLEPASR